MTKAAQKIQKLEDEFFGRLSGPSELRHDSVDIDPNNLHLPQVQNFQPKKKKAAKTKKVGP